MLFSSMIQYINADWIDYMSWKLDTDKVLTVCIYEPEDENLRLNKDKLISPAIIAIDEWNTRLKEYTNSDEYSIEITYILAETSKGKTQLDFGYCNVHIAFWEDRRDSKDTVLGVTWNKGVINGVSMSFIEIYPEMVRNVFFAEKGKDYTPEEIDKNSISLNMMIPQEAVYSVVLHEFGHSIGLGHLCDEIYGHKITSVMASKFDPFTSVLEITEYDLASVYFKYGEEGWDDNTKHHPFKYGSTSKMFEKTARCT